MGSLIGTQQHGRKSEALRNSPGIFVYMVIITCEFCVHYYSSLVYWCFGQTAHSFQVCQCPIITAISILKLVPSFLPSFLNACLDLKPWYFCYLIAWCQTAHHEVIHSNSPGVQNVLRSRAVIPSAAPVPLCSDNHLGVVLLSLEVVLCPCKETSLVCMARKSVGNFRGWSRV